MRHLAIILSFFITSIYVNAQNKVLDAPLGLRIKKNGKDYVIYADDNLKPNTADFRKINPRVYFRIVNVPTQKISSVDYQLITIPGPNKEENIPQLKVAADGTKYYPRAGKEVSEEDYDRNFWIEVDAIDNSTETEYYKYANDVFSGLLTAPFKYRLKVGNSPEALIDGDFNLASFIGWKWRLSSTRQFYIAPFSFAGVTTLNYNSANNKNIADANQLENGSGFTYGLGLSLKFDDISPGFIIGWDKGFGDLGNAFRYNDKPWISFSVNYDFFSAKKNATGSQ